MRILHTVGAAAVGLALVTSAFAAPAQAKSAAKGTSHSVTGTLDRYDAGASTIVVNTGKGTETLSLGSDSAIRMGAQHMVASDLTGHAGQKVKIRYSESNGQKMVESVQLEAPTHSAANTKPAKK